MDLRITKIMENKIETTLDILAKGIDKHASNYLLLANDPEVDDATLLSCTASDVTLISLLADFLNADKRFMEATQIAIEVAKEREKEGFMRCL